MDYRESIDYLYGLQLFGIKLGLDNIRTLLTRLGNPHQSLRCLHVAGTNGKGSVSLLLSEILRHAGYRVGLYTSPHLHAFTERIQIDGTQISPEVVCRLTGEVRQAAEGLPITFFEATTAMALQAFHDAEVDCAVIETGMGGRLDATNVINPRLVCITPVGLDHQEYLGTSLAEIAAEKAGIIKPGVPIVAGKQDAEVAAVLQQAAERSGCRLLLAERDYSWRALTNGGSLTACGMTLEGLSCSLAGEHQLDNYAQALTAALVLREQGLCIPDGALLSAGETARWPGRLEMWPQAGVLLDAAHNLLGMTSLANYLVERGRDNVHLVAGLSGSRCCSEVLAPLASLVRRMEAVPVPDAVSVPPTELTAWAARQGIEARAHTDPLDGLKAALTTRDPDSLVVVCGSLFLVAAVRSMLGEDRSFDHGDRSMSFKQQP